MKIPDCQKKVTQYLNIYLAVGIIVSMTLILNYMYKATDSSAKFIQILWTIFVDTVLQMAPSEKIQ